MWLRMGAAALLISAAFYPILPYTAAPAWNIHQDRVSNVTRQRGHSSLLGELNMALLVSRRIGRRPAVFMLALALTQASSRLVKDVMEVRFLMVSSRTGVLNGSAGTRQRGRNYPSTISAITVAINSSVVGKVVLCERSHCRRSRPRSVIW